jgi:hypothetical protein
METTKLKLTENSVQKLPSVWIQTRNKISVSPNMITQQEAEILSLAPGDVYQ